MKAITTAVIFLFFCAPGSAQSPQPSTGTPAGVEGQAASGGKVAVSVPVQTESAEVNALRAAAKPLVDLIKAQSSEMAALKRQQSAVRKQARAGAAAAGGGAGKRNKESGELNRTQREEFRKARAQKQAEHSRFVKKNPEAKKALDELLKRGVPVEVKTP